MAKPGVPRRMRPETDFPQLAAAARECRWSALVPRLRMRLRVWAQSDEALRTFAAVGVGAGAPTPYHLWKDPSGSTTGRRP